MNRPAQLPRLRVRRNAALFAGAVLLLPTVVACTTAGDSSESGDPGDFTMAAFSTGNTLDPWSTQISQYIAQATYDTLTHLDDDGTIVPWLATDWTFTDSTTLEVNLRSDVTFTDGTPFDADAVKANIEYGKTVSPSNFAAAPMLNTIDTVEVADDDTVIFHLTTANPDLPYGFSQMAGWMVSPTALEDPDSLVTTAVGTGPYILDEDASTASETYVFTKNPDYWAADEWDRFDTFTVELMSDPTAANNAALTGAVDYQTVNAVSTDIPDWEVTTGSATAFQGITFFDVDGTINPALGDVRVRQAMNYAIDRETILDEVLDGLGEVNPSTPFGTDSEGWSDDLLDIYPYDPDQATALLEEAGYGDGFTLEVLANPNWSELSQAISGYLRSVGIDVQLKEHSSDLVQQTNSGDWAAGTTLTGVYGIPFTDVTSTFTASSSMNPLANSDATVNELLTQVTETDDESEQEEIYAELATYCAEQAWFLVPALTSEQHTHNPDVVDVTEPALVGAPMLYDMVPAN